MDTRGLAIAQFNGVAVDDVLADEIGLPKVPTALANFVRAKHTGGGGNFRTTLFFGDISDPNLPNLALTDKRRNGLKPLPVIITEGTGGGFVAVKLLTFPKAFTEVGAAVCRLMCTSGVASSSAPASDYGGTTTTLTLAGTFAGSFAVGTTAIASYITPTSTLANILTSATIVAGVSSVSGSTTTPGLSSTNRSTLTGLLDNSGGTASATIATFATGATVVAAHQNSDRLADGAGQQHHEAPDRLGHHRRRRRRRGHPASLRRHQRRPARSGTTRSSSMPRPPRGSCISKVASSSTGAYISAVPVTPTLYRAEGQG
jgi:hypothetical protein